MKKFFICLSSLLILAPTAFSQEIYIPRNIKQAYKKETRSPDGKPGKNYWQNRGSYTMEIQVEPSTRIVSGTEKIIYENNSPDTLQTLAIRFVNNLHKAQSPRSDYYPNDFLARGLAITRLAIDGETYEDNAEEWGTVQAVNLRRPILPKTKTELEIDWNYELSKQSGREGQIDSTTFYVAYSYPRVSVYDDYNGWDLIPHSDRQEFYNDFNDYEYSVKAPKDYVVWGTGDLLNPEDVLQPEIADRLKKSYEADTVIHVATSDEMRNRKVTLTNEWNIWKFSTKNITDVCFALSNHYAWDASSVVVDKQPGRRVSAQAAYGENGTDFRKSVEELRYTLPWFSDNLPGVPYPFSKMTAFQGFANMEYPMMVNDAQLNNMVAARRLQNHEVAHSYFPFYMGTNETRYAFMDEGWATALDYLINLTYTDISLDSTNRAFIRSRVQSWAKEPSAENDQPVITMSTQVSGTGYRNNSYGKPALSYLALKDLLGDGLFKKALHTYMNNWNGKHPIPWDFFNSINSGSGQNLNWFFQNWFFSNNYLDLTLEKVEPSRKSTIISIANPGGFAIPFDIVITYEGGSVETFHQTPAAWKTDPKTAKVEIKTSKKVASLKLKTGVFLDSNEGDNIWKSGK